MDALPPIPPRTRRPSAILAALLGWWAPGLGHAYAGRPRKGLFFAVVVLATYALGLALADLRCVSWERDPFWFVAQSVAAGPTALVAWLTSSLSLDRRIPTFDVGLLYTAVASLLNAVVVADALGIVDDLQLAARAADAEAARRAEEEAATLATAFPAGAPAESATEGSPAADVPTVGNAPDAPPAEDAPPTASEPATPSAVEGIARWDAEGGHLPRADEPVVPEGPPA